MTVEHLLSRITAHVANIRRVSDPSNSLPDEPTDPLAACQQRMGMMAEFARLIGGHAESLREQFELEQRHFAEALTEAATNEPAHG